MSNYISLNSKLPRITKNIKIILFVIFFTSAIWIYDAFSSSSGSFEIFKKLKVGNEKIYSSDTTKKFTTESENDETTKVSTTNLTKSSQSFKYILFTKRFFGDTSWYTGKTEEAGEEVLKSVQCPVTNCIFTHNQSMLESVALFDAVVFHIPEYIHQDLIPKVRNASQLYIMVSLESPHATKQTNLKMFKDFFNITMTYRLDSDIQWDYGKVIDRETNEVVAPSPSPKWKQVEEDFYDQKIMDVIKNKTSPIAWFVSNCWVATSHRTNLANEINVTMPVDIYGRCGKLKCPVDAKECDDLLETKYRFYLSFENALCRDYVTEKIYRPLTRYVIPVVYNGGDTSLFAPPKSYINANDFENVKELTKYLQFLTDNPREYIKYFWWKKHYNIKMHPTYPYTLCDLCKKLNDEEFMTKSHRYSDIDSWWQSDVCDDDSKIKFKRTDIPWSV